MTTLVISNARMDDIIQTIKFFDQSGLLIKRISKTIKDEAKEQKGRLLGMLWGKLGASLIANLFTGKGVKAKIPGKRVWKQVKEQLELVRIFNVNPPFS